MRVYFMDDDGHLWPGDDCGLLPEHVTFSDDGELAVVGRYSPRPGVTWALRTYLDGQTRGQAQLRIYEAFRVKLASEHPMTVTAP